MEGVDGDELQAYIPQALNHSWTLSPILDVRQKQKLICQIGRWPLMESRVQSLCLKIIKRKRKTIFFFLKNSRNSSRRFLFEKRCGHRQNGDSKKKKNLFSFLHFYKNFEGVSQSAPTCVYKDSDWGEPFYGIGTQQLRNRETKHSIYARRIYLFPQTHSS